MEETTSGNRLVKIGELLIGVGALTSGDLTEAIQIAKRMGVPIGRVLVMSGCVTESNLQYALEVQSLVKDGLCDLDIGMKALNKVFKERIDLQTALKQLNWAPKQDANSNKLGELLIDSNIVTRGQLDRALEASFQSGMPLGGTLVLQGVLSAQLLPTILHTQEQIRNNNLSREDALQTLQQALIFWARADQSKDELELQGSPRNTPGKQAPRRFAVEGAEPHTDTAPLVVPSQPAAPTRPAPGPAKAKTPPQIAGDKPYPVLDNKAKPWLQSHDSIDSLKKRGGAPAPDETATAQNVERPPVQEKETEPVSLVELMKLSGFCTQNTIDKSIEQALSDSRLASKMFLAIGFLDSTTLNTFVYCQAMIAKGELRTDQALYVLNSIRNRKMTLEQALGELGISSSLLE